MSTCHTPHRSSTPRTVPGTRLASGEPDPCQTPARADTGRLDRREARALTDAINATSEMLHVLIARAKAGKAWLALGYRSFAEYVDCEFHISRSRAYQFLDQHKVVAAIAATLPEGVDMPIITEAAARDLKWVLDDLLAAIRERTQRSDSRDLSGVVADTISEYRDAPRDLHRPPVDESQIQNLRVTMSLFSALQSLTALPDPQSVTTAVPAERCEQISATLRDAIAWLTEFEKAWTGAALLTN